MNIGSIIAEADILVPNDVSVVDKVFSLIGLNLDFFNVVKIDRVVQFNAVKDQDTYILPNDLRQKNIDFVMCGVIKYHELTSETPHPMQNTFSFDDSTYTLTLRPSPYTEGLKGITRYKRIATTQFSSTNLTVTPDAPEEYHYSFVYGLAAFIANTQDDAIKASNYENQYKSMWNVAAQNYAKEVTQ